MSGDEVTEIEYSTDGGTSWTKVSKSGNGFAIDGLEITIVDSATNAVDQTGTISAKAKYAELQLKNDVGDLGTAAKVYGDQVSVVIGDQATNRTAHVTFDFATLNAGDATISRWWKALQLLQ